MPRVVVIDGKRQSFPDDATDQEISAALGAIPAANAEHAPKARTWTDTAVDALPAALGTAGAVLGGMGGAAFGMGFGGVPGAAGGATLGTGAGEAAKQLINRLRGADAPATRTDAAMEIGVPALEAGVSTAVLGGAAKLVPAASRAMLKGAVKAAGTVHPDIVSIASPRAGAAMKVLNKVGEAAVAKSENLPKVKITSTDYTRIKELVAQGISEKDAVRTILNLKARALP